MSMFKTIFCELPAMFPRAQTACSLMCWWGDVTRLIKAGMAPPSTTAAVWSEVPEAMLVRAQEASNWMGGQSISPRKATNLGMRPVLIIWLMGGCLSRDSSFLQSDHSTSESSMAVTGHFECVLKRKVYIALGWIVTLQPVWPGAATQHYHCSLLWESLQRSTVGQPAKCHTGGQHELNDINSIKDPHSCILFITTHSCRCPVQMFMTVLPLNNVLFIKHQIEPWSKYIYFYRFKGLPDSFGFFPEGEKSHLPEMQTHFFFWRSDHPSSPCGARRSPPLSCGEAPAFIRSESKSHICNCSSWINNTDATPNASS